MRSVIVKLGIKEVEIVCLRQSLMRGWRLEEVYVLFGIVLAIDEFVDLFFATEEVAIALEEALS